MPDRDLLGMTEEESDVYFSSLVKAEKAIEQIVNLDPERRMLIWRDGSALSFDESVQRIHGQCPDQPADLIHGHLRGWLEQGELPQELPEAELERLDELVTQWAEEIPQLP